MFCVVSGACAEAEETNVHQAYNTPQYRWQHANKWPKKQLYNWKSLCCLWCTTWGPINNWAQGLQYNTTLPDGSTQLLWCKDKEVTKTEPMHQHVNIMTKNKVEHLHYKTHLVCVNEWDGAITLITINGNPTRWRVSDSNPEYEY